LGGGDVTGARGFRLMVKTPSAVAEAEGFHSAWPRRLHCADWRVIVISRCHGLRAVKLPRT
jgi:hypothetical protein